MKKRSIIDGGSLIRLCSKKSWFWNSRKGKFIYYVSFYSSYGSLVYYVLKIFQKTNISYPLIRTRTFAFLRVGNVSFLENFARVVNEWCLTTLKTNCTSFVPIDFLGNSKETGFFSKELNTTAFKFIYLILQFVWMLLVLLLLLLTVLSLFWECLFDIILGFCFTDVVYVVVVWEWINGIMGK